jgi:hypothetical protein
MPIAVIMEYGMPNPVSFRFMNWSMPAGALYTFGSMNFWGQLYIAEFQDCQLYGGQILSYFGSVAFTNCLFQRVNVELNDVSGSHPLSFYNNLLLAGILNLSNSSGGTWTFCDNLFDQTAITQNNRLVDVCLSNAYVANFPTLASTANSAAVILTNSPDYEFGALGAYYYPDDLPLIHDGSRSAAAAGLYHYTVTTNNVVEGTNMVSIGFHYISVDANG